MFEEREHSQLANLLFIAAALYIFVNLVRRRLGWFAEKFWGFLVFTFLGFLGMYMTAHLFSAVTQDPLTGNDVFAPGWELSIQVVGWASGITWVIFSVLTWKEAHHKAMIKWEAAKAAKKAHRRQQIAQFRRDYGV